MAKSRGQSLGARGAVIFGDEASSGLQQNLSTIQDIERRRQAQNQQRAQEMARSWRDNMLKADSGMLWRDEIGAEEQKHMNQGILLKNSGIDPYNSLDPRAQEYRLERQRIIDMRNRRSAVEEDLKTLNKAILTDREKYRPEDIEAIQNFASNTPFSDIYSNTAQIPQLRERFVVSEALKGFRPTQISETIVENGEEVSRQYVDQGQAEREVLARLGQSPGGMEYISSITSGYSIPEIRNAPDTIEATETLVEGMYDSDPTIRENLAIEGIVSKSDPRFSKYVEQEARQLNSAKKNFEKEIGQLVESASAGLTVRNTRKPNYTEENQQYRRNSEARAVRSEQRSIESHNKSISKDADETKFVNSSIPYQGTQNGKSVVVSTPAVDSKNVKISAARLSTTEAWDLSNGGAKTNPRKVIKGDISRLAQVPMEKGTGRIVQQSYADNNPDKVEWRKVALVSSKNSDTGLEKDYLVPVETVQENLTKDQRSTYNEFMNRPTRKSSSQQEGGATTGTPKASTTTLSFFK